MATLERTVRRLAATPGIALVRASRWVRTPPMRGGTAQNWFANGVIVVDTTLGPDGVLARCVVLEAEAGRRRGRFWADRPLDLDLLLADGLVVDTPSLKLPHPGIPSRRFFLEPLLEVWPDAVDPLSGVPYAAFPTAPGPKPVRIGVLGPRRPIRFLG